MLSSKKRFKLIACEVMFREICLCASKCKNIVDISFLEQGLHDMGDKIMREKLQAEINKTSTEDYDAILLCYGLCNNGTQGIHADIPLVIPRAHDCITLLMGSKERYKDYFFTNPGTYFYSSGWLERDAGECEGGISQKFGLDKDASYYAELFGDENAEYLADMLGDTMAYYKKIAYINTGTGTISEDRESARESAEKKGWEFEEIAGDLALIFGLLDGDWDEDKYLIVNPGSIVTPSNDDLIVTSKRKQYEI